MEENNTSKSSRRMSRSRPITAPLPKFETQRLERLFEDTDAAKKTNWSPNQNDTDVINIRSLLQARSMYSQERRENAKHLFDDRIIINVCGDRFETHRTTLELYPDTLLGNVKQRHYYYDKARKEYFFDRHRGCFEAILYYYQSHGRIRRPEYIPLDIFLEEITFFKLGQAALNQIRKDENIKEVKKVRLPKNPIRRYIWATMEYPDYSLLAKIVNIVSLVMIIVSTVTFATESLPQYADLDELNCGSAISTTKMTTTSFVSNQTLEAQSSSCDTYFISPFFLIQATCVGFFTIEFIVRVATAPSLLEFVKNIMNWIDFLAIVPFYITLGILLNDRQGQSSASTYVGLRLLRILRLARVFKFFRIFKNVKSLRVLGTTVRQSLLDFLIMIIILTLLGFLFGAAAYYAENDENNEMYDSILKATYWGIITVTSVGYGDITPKTPAGRVIGCLCALFGAATIGMLVSVLVDRYQRVFARRLFINQDNINFDDYSDDDDSDGESDTYTSADHGKASKIENPDARAKNTRTRESEEPETPQSPDLPLEEADEDNPSSHDNGRIRFIVRYVDDENQEVSDGLEDKTSSAVLDKRKSGNNPSLRTVSNDITPENSPYNGRFKADAIPSDNDDDNDQDLSEIGNDSRNKGSVLKTFRRSLSFTRDHLTESETIV